MANLEFYDSIDHKWKKSCFTNLEEAKKAYPAVTYRFVEAESKPAVVTAQTHYAGLKPEPIDVIDGWGLNYNRGNALKYLSRAGKKDQSKEGTIKDLEKAISYLKREINTLNGKPGW